MIDALGQIDLANPDHYVDGVPFEWFDQLRHEHPVVWHPEQPPNQGFWAITRHDDLTAVHMDWETFSSEIGAVGLEELDEEQLQIRNSMLETDPPRHTQMRKICSKRFSARDVRLAEPADDVIAALVAAQNEGALDEREYHNYFALLLIAGNETTRHTISSGMLALAEHLDQLELLRDEPDLMSRAVEEILRWATPVMHFRRTATRDVELRGQRIKAGDKVVTWYISANRDEEVFPDPHRFDVMRTPNDHVTFGPGGPHFCLGAHLARLETKIVFQDLLPRLRSIEITGSVERIRSDFVNGIKRMRVRVNAAERHVPRCTQLDRA